MTHRWTMPPEWAPHTRTWMAWPCSRWVLANDPEGAFRAWADVANAVATFEPVIMMVQPGKVDAARALLDPSITIIEHDIGESWMRDFGPTFVRDDAGRLGAVDWTFNGWGGRTFPECAMDARIAKRVADEAGAVHLPSKLVNEGGAIHVDGEGTLLMTESVQLNANRNPHWSKAEVEAECHRLLGTSKVIWLERGVVADVSEVGTDGHVDTLACFVKPGVVVIHDQPDPEHPDHEVSLDIIHRLEHATDAKGRPLEIVKLTAPAERYDEAGEPLSCSYVNFSFVNGGVVLCGFDDPKDAEAADVFRRLLPERKVVTVPAIRIFEGGGGVHCITQHEPVSGGAS